MVDFEREKRFKQFSDTPEDRKGLSAEQVLKKQFGKRFDSQKINGKTLRERFQKEVSEEPFLRELMR